MKSDDLKQLRSHLRALRGQQDSLTLPATKGNIVIDSPTFRIIYDEIERIRARFPALVPPLRPAELVHNTGLEKDNYFLAPLRTYLATVIAKIEAEIETLPAVDVPSMTVTREGVFFAGQYFDAYQRVSEILERAHTSISIIDNYVDATVLDRLTSKGNNVAVNILTRSVSSAFITAATAFQKQYGGLSIRKSSAFHDRFIIIDDTDFYHLGASIKDAGARGFMFSRIEEGAVIEAFRQAWIREWAAASMVM